MQTFPSDSIPLTVTSPPYDGLRLYKGYAFNFEAIAKELYRITMKGGVVVWIVNDQTIDGTETGTSFKQALYFKSIGFNLHDTMIWHKHSPPLTHNRYEQHFEYMFILSKGKPRTFNPIMELKNWQDNRKHKMVRRETDGSFDMGYCSPKRMKIKGNVWRVDIGGGHTTEDDIAVKHDAVMPEQLAEDHIKSWSNEGDIVLDPMCGSGTTLKAAEKLNRKWIGIEVSPEYIEIANKRIERYGKNGRLTPSLSEQS